MRSLFNHITIGKLWLIEQFEAQRDTAFLWWPVWLGVGISAFFALPYEPEFYWVFASAVCVVALMFILPRGFLRFLVSVILLAIIGFGAAQVRSWSIYTPMLQDSARAVEVIGRIKSVEPMDTEGRQLRFVIEDVEIDRLEALDTPKQVRLSLRSKEVIEGYHNGALIKGLATLNDPSVPVLPNGFDFRRHLYFKGIGAVGYFYRPPEVIEVGVSKGVGVFQHLRETIAQRVLAVLPDESGAVVVALLTGQRGSIPDEDLDAMRYSGLAHMLAISGLHVGLFSGVVFFVLRLFMVAIPGVALHFPVKKIAAILAFGAACFYMMLAGATIPTQRAVLMIGVVFLAVVLDRTALSMRLVSFAALLVLLIMPESLLSVSFQLSFAAVVALIWVYDVLREWLSGAYRQAGFVRKCGLYVGGVALTSLVATISTSPFSLYHFQTLAVFGVLANIVAMPLMSFLIMPFAVLVLAMMPFGLEAIPLWVMGHGVEAVLAVAQAVSDLPHSVLRVEAWPFAAMVSVVCGVLVFVLMRGPLRFLGVIGLVAAGFVMTEHRMPDIMIAESHDLWAYRGEDDGFYVSARNKERFMRENWERALGLPDGAAVRWDADEDLQCDDMACRIELRGTKVSFMRKIEAARDECAWADVLVTQRTVAKVVPKCRAAVIIDHAAVKAGGTHSVYLTDGGSVRVDSVRSHLGRRLWH